MDQVLEIHEIEQLGEYRELWRELLEKTPAASFFQSLEWLEVYWRHFGREQKLRTFIVMDGDRGIGIVPLVVRSEETRIGPVRVLTYPLHDWGSFYGPIGEEPRRVLEAALRHVHETPRDWDLLELRWQGAVGTDPTQTQEAMVRAGFHAYPTVRDCSAVVEISGTWDAYWATRKRSWRQRFRAAERRLAQHGEISYVRYRPAGEAYGDGSPRWDLYDMCEEIAQRSWQGGSTDGTTLSHPSVRNYLRETHAAAAAAGAADINLLMVAGAPIAFVYGYCSRGYVYGLRRGYDADESRDGAGNVLLNYVLRDSFVRHDRIYDMGIGSLASKRHFQTRLVPILRFSHFPILAFRAQLLRARRWWQQKRSKFIAVGRVQDSTTDLR